MKQTSLVACVAGVLVVVALLVAACVPISVSTPATITPLAGAEPQGTDSSGVAISPLQPTAAAGAPLTVAPLATMQGVTAAQPQTLVGPLWEWVSSTFKEGTVLAPGDSSRYTFQLLEDGNATIQADCNFGAGTWQGSGEGLTFGSIGTTKMACPPDSLDSAFLAQLQNAAAYNLGTDGLVIFLKDEAGTMRLRAVPGEATPTALPPTVAPTATESPMPLPSPTPVPTDTPVPTETNAPPTPVPTETLVALPTAVVTPTALPTATAIPLPVATVAPTAVAAPPTAELPSLNGSSWRLTSLMIDGEAVRPSVFRTPITLVVAEDGSEVSGVAGCNQYRSMFDASANDGTLFRPALTTRVVCGGNIMVQEVAFLDALLRARSYTVQENDLTFSDAAGNVLMVLLRQ